LYHALNSSRNIYHENSMVSFSNPFGKSTTPTKTLTKAPASKGRPVPRAASPKGKPVPRAPSPKGKSAPPSIFDQAKSAAAGQAKSSAKSTGEAAALKSAGASDTQVAAYQDLEKGLGGTAAISSGMTTGAKSITSTISAMPAWIYGGLTFAPKASMWQIGVGMFIYILLLAFFLYFLYFLYKKAYPPKPAATVLVQNTKASSTANVLNAAMSNSPDPVDIEEGFVDATKVSGDDYTLLNVQPLTIKQAGFLGPIQAGVFDDSATANSLRAGFRSFILQIDFMETQKDGFSKPNMPTLVYRGDDGSLLSKNSADISAVAQAMANVAFRPEVPNYTEPVIIYLHILRAPNPINSADEYQTFLSRIASSLNPLAPYHLGMTPLGTFNRQKQESILVNSPLKTFKGQVILLCNADTSIFRKAKVNPADDLDFWVNLRVYLNSNETLGVTQMPPTGVTPFAVVTKMSSLLALSEQEATAFASASKTKLVIALPSQMENPAVDKLDTLLHKFGVNMVPLDIYSDDVKEVLPLVAQYNNMTFSPKPPGLLNTK
jgi:hypothetical protein